MIFTVVAVTYLAIGVACTLVAATMWATDGKSEYAHVRSESRREARVLLIGGWTWPVTVLGAIVEMVFYKGE